MVVTAMAVKLYLIKPKSHKTENGGTDHGADHGVDGAYGS